MSAPKQVKVFVSSTFRDMQEERFRLATHTFQQLRFQCESKGIEFSVVDLRWGITEEESHGGQVLRRCLNEIDKCRPYFMCMLGERYGWCHHGGMMEPALATTIKKAMEDGHQWIERYKNRSITEMEIVYGALEPALSKDKRPAKGALRGSSESLHGSAESFGGYERPRALAFMRNELYATKRFAIGDERRADFESESTQHYQKLRELKERIYASPQLITAIEYDSPTDLVTKALGELWRLMTEDFPELLESEAPERTFLQRTPLERNDKAVQQCFLSSKMFVGRQKLLQSMLEVTRKKTSGVTVVTGKSGCGLSCLLAKVGERFASSSTHHVVPLFVGTTWQTRSVNSLALELIERLKALYHIAMSVPEEEEAPEHVSAWFQAAHRHACDGDRKLLVIIDGLDKLSEKGRAAVRWIPPVLPSSMRLIVSTCSTSAFDSKEESEALKALRERGNSTITTVEHLNEVERRALAESFLSPHGKKLSVKQLQMFVKHPACGMPRFATVVLNQLTRFGTFDMLSEQLGRYLSTDSFQGLYELVLSDWEDAYERSSGVRGSSGGVVSSTLSALALLRGGLREAELMSAVKVADVCEWTPFFQVLQGNLSELADGSVALLNKHLIAAVKNRYLSTKEAQRAASLKLVTFFESRPLTCESTLRELPHLLISVISLAARNVVAGTVSRLVNFLSDPAVVVHMFASAHKEELFQAWDAVERAQGPSAVDVYERVIGRNDASRALVDAVASFHVEGGRFRAAQRALTRLVSIDRAASGRESLALAQGYLRLAEVALELGERADVAKNCAQARSLFEKVTAREEKDSRLHSTMAQFSFMATEGTGGDSPALIGLIRSISLEARNAKKQGKYAEAAELYRSAIAAAKKRLAQPEGELAELHSLAADVERKLGQYDEAQRSYQAAVQVLEKKYGPVHPVVVRTQRSIALVHKKQGKYDAAKRLYEQLLAAIAAVFGNAHYLYGVVLGELADVMRKQGSYKECEGLYRTAIEVIESSLGPEHSEMVDVLYNLGRLLKTNGVYPEALRLYERAIEIVERCYGTEHYKYTMLLIAIGDVERKCGNYDRAGVMYMDALDVMEATLGPDHVEIPDVLNSLGLVSKKLAQYEKAMRCYSRALDIIGRVLGRDHLKYGVVLNNIGDVRRKQCQFPEAMQTLEEAKRVIAGAVGEDHSEMAEVYHSIGKLHAAMGDIPSASDCIRRSIRMTKEVLGPAHPKVGFYTNSLGETLQGSSPQKALDVYGDALSLLITALGSKHPEVADVHTNIGKCRKQVKNNPGAAEAFNKAIRIVHDVFGMDHPKFSTLCELIRSVGGTVQLPQMLPASTAKRTKKRRGAAQGHDQLVNAVMAMSVMGWV